jgi:intraflagellar transport protein 122
VLHALAKQAVSLGAFKLARTAYDRLLQLRLAPALRDAAEAASLVLRAQPYSDREELQPLCFRCSAVNRLLGQRGDACSSCHHEVVRSFFALDALPLVEFVLAAGIAADEAAQLIAAPPKRGAAAAGGRRSSGWHEGGQEGSRALCHIALVTSD